MVRSGETERSGYSVRRGRGVMTNDRNTRGANRKEGGSSRHNPRNENVPGRKKNMCGK